MKKRSSSSSLVRLSLLAALSTGLALATSCFPLLARGVADTGVWMVVAIAAAGALAWVASRFHAELASMFPCAGGIRTYVGRAFGDRAGIALAVAYLSLVVALGAAEADALASVLSTAFPGSPPAAWIAGLIGIAVIANVIGFEIAAGLQAALGGSLVLGLVAASGGALGSGNLPAAPPPAAAVMIAATASATFLFLGFEWVVSAAEEVGEHRTALPRAMTVSLITLTATYGAVAIAMAVAPPAVLSSSAAPLLVLGAVWGGRIGILVTTTLCVLATVTSFNAGILGASRLVYALARERVFPASVASVHPTFHTPVAAVLAVAAVVSGSAFLVARTGMRELPVVVGAAIECVAFAAVALAARRLRQTDPARPRPYRAPFGSRAALCVAAVFLALAVASVLSVPKLAAGGLLTLGAIALSAGALSHAAVQRRNPMKKHASFPPSRSGSGLVAARIECLVALAAAVALAFAHRADIRWPVFVALFVGIDIIGYLPGAIAHRRARGGKIPDLYYFLYNATHSVPFHVALVAAISLVSAPEWAFLAIPIHLFGDRALFGNFWKSRALPFEPAEVAS
jgi:amino acid transporter